MLVFLALCGLKVDRTVHRPLVYRPDHFEDWPKFKLGLSRLEAAARKGLSGIALVKYCSPGLSAPRSR
jgi:hypothetical protein